MELQEIRALRLYRQHLTEPEKKMVTDTAELFFPKGNRTEFV